MHNLEVELLAKSVLVVAIITGLSAAPTAAILFWHTYSLTWEIELQKYQTLAGGLITLFAASLATTGVLLTIAAQRREQRRSRLISRQQTASAFIGELTVILDELKHELVGPVLRKALNDVQTGTGKVSVSTVRLLNTAKYYDNNPGNVGVFPNLLPQELTRFYSDLHAFATCLDRYASAAEHVMAEGTLPATTSTHWIIYSIQDALKKLDSCLKRGRVLIAELEVIRNAKVD